MIGKNFPQMIRYTVIGGVILIVGTQLLASVIEVVIALRFGDFLPFLSIVAITILLMRLTRNMKSETPLHVLMNLIAWTATGYLMVLAFMLVIPFGLVAALVVSGITAITLEQLRNPLDIQRLSRLMIPFCSKIAYYLVFKVVNSKKFTAGVSLWIVPLEYTPIIIDLIQTRPMLPIALTHFQDEDILFINEFKNSPSIREIKRILKANGVPRLERASPLHTWFILNLLLFEMDNFEQGHLKDCCIIHDERTLEMVLSNWPLGGTIFSSSKGLMMFVESSSIVGYNSLRIPKGLEPWVLVKQDISTLNFSEG